MGNNKQTRGSEGKNQVMSLMKEETRKKEIVEFASTKGIIIQKDAFSILSKKPDWKETLERLIKEKESIISRQLLEGMVKSKISVIESKAMTKSNGFSAPAKSEKASFRIMKELDVTGQSYSEGTVQDFLNFFQQKFKALSKILKQRHTLKPKPIKRLKYVALKSNVDVIGMVRRKWITKNNHTAIELEDLEEKTIAVIPKDKRELEKARDTLMPDDVIAIKATKVSNDLLIVNELFWADLPQRKRKTIEKDIAIASISDMHIGSKLFLEQSFKKFLDWINGRIGTTEEKEEIGKIKYLIINGDNVDGIGIYPKQFDELNIKDIREQYEEFSDYILQIPEYIEIFIIPGQHDAVRWADPQPAIPEKMVPRLAEKKNIHLLGSPTWVEIEGLKTLIYHGSSMHDLFSSIAGLDYAKPQNAMIELLKKRDLMPAYGLRQPYVPEKKDFMVISEEPDLVFIGDLHHSGYGTYRGTLIVNNSTWQDRTEYQVKLGHVPTPGIVPIVNLHTGRIKEMQFQKGER